MTKWTCVLLRKNYREFIVYFHCVVFIRSEAVSKDMNKHFKCLKLPKKKFNSLLGKEAIKYHHEVLSVLQIPKNFFFSS